MQLGISNIGWDFLDVEDNVKLSLENGFDYIESVYAKTYLSRSVYAIQGIFYKSGINSFEDPLAYSYCYSLIDYCLKNNIKIITFGSPSMRLGDKKYLLNLLSSMDKYIGKNNCIICVEPNARIYGGEYYYSLDEIVADIQNFKNIKTMIDTGNLSAECIDPISEFTKYHEFIHHIHISSPDLQPIVDYKSYKNFILNIKNSEYNKNITYEYMNSRNINKEITEFINLFKM
jgi:hypothetical protein